MPPQLLAGDAMPGYKVETCCPDRSCRGESGPDAGVRFETTITFFGGRRSLSWWWFSFQTWRRGPGREQDRSMVQMLEMGW